MSASLAFQQAARAQLGADAAVSALVPIDRILDTGGKPAAFPCIRIGEGQELITDEFDHFTTVYSTFHVWADGPDLASVKAIAGAMRKALRGQTWKLVGYQCLNTKFESARYVRDPDGMGHAIVTFAAVIAEE